MGYNGYQGWHLLEHVLSRYEVSVPAIRTWSSDMHKYYHAKSCDLDINPV